MPNYNRNVLSVALAEAILHDEVQHRMQLQDQAAAEAVSKPPRQVAMRPELGAGYEPQRVKLAAEDDPYKTAAETLFATIDAGGA